MHLLVSFRPNTVVERQGDVGFEVVPIGPDGAPGALRSGQVPVGGTFDAGELALAAPEIRYWVGMDVRYDPGLTVILASLCAGLGGMVITFVGRVRQGAGRRRRAEAGGPRASALAGAGEGLS
jgi:hypothetical protein